MGDGGAKGLSLGAAWIWVCSSEDASASSSCARRTPPISPGPAGAVTSVVQQLPAVDLVLHHIGPVEGALAEVEVQGDGVAQAGHQNAVVAFVKVDAPDLVAVGEDDEWLEGVWGGV